MNRGMKKLSSKERKLYIIIGSAGFAVLAVIFTYFKPLNMIDYMVSDLIYQSIVERQESNSNIKIISIDDETVKKLGDFSEWSRSKTAGLIEFLNGGDERPDVIAFGLDYHNTRDDDGDDELVEVCSEYNNICIGASVETEPEGKKRAGGQSGNIANTANQNENRQIADTANADYKADFEDFDKTGITAVETADMVPDIPHDTMAGQKITGVMMPFEELLPYIQTGIINTCRSAEDGYIRNMVASINYEGTDYDSFAVAVCKMHLRKTGKTYQSPSVDDQNSFGINYSKNEDNYEIYSFYEVITGKVDKEVFDNSIVLVGDYTDSNNFNVPNRKDGQMNEIELQANIINALVQNNTLQYAERWFLAIWYALFAALFFIATSYSSGPSTVFYTLCLIFLEILGSCVLNVWGFYIPLLQLIILVVSIAIVNLVSGYIIAQKRRSSLEEVFKKYVDEQVVNEIVKDGRIDASIGGVRKDIAVLFVDIRGFTSLSEKLAPEQVVDILNSYLTIIAEAVASYGGTLDKFIGDAAMAVYNSPSDLEDYVFKAVCTAWDILSNASELRDECLKKYNTEVAFGIGVNCGEAVIGNIGSQNRMEYTAIGDTVNTTSRLEGAAGKGQILVSKEVADRLANRIEVSFAGDFSLKGKKNRVPAYEVTGLKEQPEPVKREKSIEEIYEENMLELKKAHEKCLNDIQTLKELTGREIKELGEKKVSEMLEFNKKRKDKVFRIRRGGK